jgi:hypothetical protein
MKIRKHRDSSTVISTDPLTPRARQAGTVEQPSYRALPPLPRPAGRWRLPSRDALLEALDGLPTPRAQSVAHLLPYSLRGRLALRIELLAERQIVHLLSRVAQAVRLVW